jgi:hypothetical protein
LQISLEDGSFLMRDKKAGFGKMTCNICRDNNTLYLYTKKDLIFSLCERCLKTQDKIDEFNSWAYEQILQAKMNGETPF